jgi:hypothetical protein
MSLALRCARNFAKLALVNSAIETFLALTDLEAFYALPNIVQETSRNFHCEFSLASVLGSHRPRGILRCGRKVQFDRQNIRHCRH